MGAIWDILKSMPPLVLATDLDGTLIPLNNDPRNQQDLRVLEEQLRQASVQLVYVTGRHLASVTEVMQRASLPVPEWIIADVGTAIYQRAEEWPGGDRQEPSFVKCAAYAAELQELIHQCSVSDLQKLLAPIDELQLQESEKQSAFKLSYYAASARLTTVQTQIATVLKNSGAPYWIVASVDPFTGVGLVDLLPKHVTKAYGIQWWARWQAIEPERIVYAGDSGNDSAVFAAGFRSIVVGNAAPEVRSAAAAAHARAGWNDRLYAAELPATSGVLAGIRHFLLT